VSGKDSSGCLMPRDVRDDEKIVRAIKTPYHFDQKKLKLRPAAFVPPAGGSDVSVVRTVNGESFAAEQARQVSKPSEYVGVAVAEALNFRSLGTEVYDYKEDFCGHAHLNHGIPVPPKGEVFEPQLKMALDDRCKAIIARCRFHPDTHENVVGWLGGPL
jgi:hypothetical protein